MGHSPSRPINALRLALSSFARTLLDDTSASDMRTTLGLGTLATQSGTFSGTSSGTNTGDQTITLTGDVTGSGTGSFAASISSSVLTTAARTVLDDSTVAAMVDTLGGASATGTGGLARATSPTFVTPLLGTPTSGTLTNCTGLPVSTGISGLASGAATFLATPSSANLAALCTDETGSGALVFATSPTLVTPALGTPSSGTLTNCTGLPATGIADATSTPTASKIPISASDKRLASGWMRHWMMCGRRYTWQHDVGGTTISSTGTTVTLSQVGTATPSNQDSSTMPREQHLTGSVSGNAGGRETSASFMQRSWGGGMAARWSLGPNISNVRHWCGFSSAALDQVATPTTQHVAAFRYDTGVDGTAFIRCVTCDGASNVTTTTTSVAADNDTTRPGGYFARIEWDSSNVYFYLDDVLVATHTTNLPGTTTQVGIKMAVTTLTTAAKRNAWSWLSAWHQ